MDVFLYIENVSHIELGRILLFFSIFCSITVYTIHGCEAMKMENKYFQLKFIKKVLPIGIALVLLGSDVPSSSLTCPTEVQSVVV